MKLNQIIILCLTIIAVSSLFAASTAFYKLTLASGISYEGFVVKEKPDGSVLFKTTGGIKYLFVKSEISDLTEIEPTFSQRNEISNSKVPNRGSFGVGLGVPYGIFGFGGDIFVSPQVAATIGVGTAFVGPAFDLGMRYYLRDMENSWRPRVSLFYGVNSAMIVLDEDNIIDEENSDTFLGISVGIGQQWALGYRKRTGIDFDLHYLVTTGVFDRADELAAQGYEVSAPSRITISFGIRHNF